MKLRYQIFSLLLLICHFIYPQGYEGTPCTIGDAILKKLLLKEGIKEMSFQECNHNLYTRSTSFLKADGTAPPEVGDPNFTGEPAEGSSAFDRWTCKYAADHAIDGDKNTAWVEGVSGNGSGELLLIRNLDLSRGIEILAGLGKSAALFVANNRPKTINVHLVQAAGGNGNDAQCSTFLFNSIVIIGSKKLTLRDVNQFQALPIPFFKKENFSYWLMIELIDVYKGTKYDDTCISEIRNVK